MMVRGFGPLADNATVDAQPADHVALALFNKFHFLSKSCGIGTLAKSGDYSLT
jgi:hypothetical protein